MDIDPLRRFQVSFHRGRQPWDEGSRYYTIHRVPNILGLEDRIEIARGRRYNNDYSTEYAVYREYQVVGVFRKYAGWQGTKRILPGALR